MKTCRSLRVRLIFSYLALALLLLIFSGYVFSNALSIYANSVQRSQQALYLKQAAKVLGEASRRNLSGDETLALLRQYFPGLIIELEGGPSEKVTVPGVPNILVFPGKPVLSDSEPLMLQTQGEAPSLYTGKILFMGSASNPGESSFSIPTETFSNGVPSITTYRFTMGPSAFAFLSNIYRQVLEVLVLALALAVLIGWLLSKWIARPLSHLAAATEVVAGGNFLETVDRSGIIELDRLGEHFNRMVLHLRESFRTLATERDSAKRFAADAAHELKTPVATLRAYHDVLTDRPERLQQVGPAVGRQIERMEKVINGLLQLANLVEDNEAILEPTDLCSVIRQLESGYQNLAGESGCCLTATFPRETVQVLTNQYLLELALNNLMENACKYTEPGGKVALTLQVDDNEAIFKVQDTGKGITPEELPFIFDRFHRGVDTQSIPGSGLGLAIAQEAVKRIGGTLVVESKVEHGSQFSISLPILPVKEE
jgi:signal transduction histidine kinase